MVDSCSLLQVRLMTAIMIPCYSIWIITNHSTIFKSKQTRRSSLVMIPYWRAQWVSSSSRWPRRSRTSRSGSICKRSNTSRSSMMPSACMNPSVNRPTRCTSSTTPTFIPLSRSSRLSSKTTFRIISRRPCNESTRVTSTLSIPSCSVSN